jgi:hypothetical protein
MQARPQLALFLLASCAGLAGPSLTETEQFLNDYGETEQSARTGNTSVAFSVNNCEAESFSFQRGGPLPDDADSARRDQLSTPEVRKDVQATPDSTVLLKLKDGRRFLTVGFYDATNADRVKKALDRWLELCPDKKEPF